MYSPTRKTYLFTAEEVAAELGMSMRNLRRHIQTARERTTLYSERVKIAGKRGAPVLYMDILTLGLTIPAHVVTQFASAGHGTQIENSVPGLSDTAGIECQTDVPAAQPEKTPIASLLSPVLPQPTDLALKSPIECQTDVLTIARHDASQLLAATQDNTYRDTDPAAARELYAAILPVLNQPAGSRDRGRAVKAVAAARNVDESTVRDWVTRFEREGLTGLMPQVRRDRGAFRLSQETLQVVVAAIITNPPSTSARKLHQMLLLAVPQLMQTKRAGRTTEVSLATVTRIRDALLKHPRLKLMMYNADQRKEFLRTYMGRVLAAHANDMWQQDMTRCDVLVFDEDTNSYYRPRVQAVIDLYSGCIPGIAFSPDEDQVQADLAFFRALLQPQGPLASRYPIYGRPRRLYIDNGKTYSSVHFERIIRELGIELIHSRPYVSHTRGAIERFFRTLHLFEATLPGYVGQDAADRSSEELKRLMDATRRWRETGRDPGEGNRLMTLREYQIAVLRWLIVDYHQQTVDGRTRLEWFTSSAPAHSLIEFDLGELLIHFAHREERIVRPDCTVTVDNVLWTCPDGALGGMAGTRVLVLRDAMVLGEDVRVIALRERAGHLRILGRAIQAPDNAASIEAGELRRVNKLAKRELLQDADALRHSIADPALLIRRQHERELPVVPVTALPAAARAQITSVTPEPTPDLGAFGKSFLRADEPTDMETFRKSLQSLLEEE